MQLYLLLVRRVVVADHSSISHLSLSPISSPTRDALNMKTFSFKHGIKIWENLPHVQMGMNTVLTPLLRCPGFSWDRVNFHNKLVELTQTANQMGHSIPCDVMLSI